ncbi:MAG: hypothetical protein ACKO24_02670 [Leptolyngbyaceae cyanobacterium]
MGNATSKDVEDAVQRTLPHIGTVLLALVLRTTGDRKPTPNNPILALLEH